MFVIRSRCCMLYFVLLYLNTKTDSLPQLRKRGIDVVSVRRGRLFLLVPRLRYLSLVLRKPVFGVSDHVRYKPSCVVTEDD